MRSPIVSVWEGMVVLAAAFFGSARSLYLLLEDVRLFDPDQPVLLIHVYPDRGTRALGAVCCGLVAAVVCAVLRDQKARPRSRWFLVWCLSGLVVGAVVPAVLVRSFGFDTWQGNDAARLWLGLATASISAGLGAVVTVRTGGTEGSKSN